MKRIPIMDIDSRFLLFIRTCHLTLPSKSVHDKITGISCQRVDINLKLPGVTPK